MYETYSYLVLSEIHSSLISYKHIITPEYIKSQKMISKLSIQYVFKKLKTVAVLVGFTENFCIDLSGGQRKMYQPLCCTRVGK